MCDVSSASAYLLEQGLGVVDQLSRCNLIKVFMLEGRSVEHGSHLRRYGVTLRSNSGDFIFKRRVCRVISGIARKRCGRNLQTGKGESPERRVDLLINMGELRQRVFEVAQSLRYCVIVDRLCKYPAVVDV